MTDEHLDRMVRDADPYRPDVAHHLDGAAQSLLEEIMSVPTLERVAEPPGKRPRIRRRLITAVAGASVAAAVLAGVFALSATNADRPGDRPGDRPATGSAVGVHYSALVLKAAEENPRLLINQPGWTATYVSGFTEKAGAITFSKGGKQLEMDWYPASQYASYHLDRLHVSKPVPVRVAGWPGERFRYTATDFAVMLRPRDVSFVEMRTGNTWTRAEFDRVLAAVVRVDARTWLAALPPEIVTPDRIDKQAAKVLADVPLPPGFEVATLKDLGSNDPYQFGAKVTGRVGCGWIAEWQRAKQAGDTAGLERAGEALRSSHQWKVLRQLKDQGDWSEVFWEVTDQVAAGHPPVGYESSLGCEN